MADLPGFDGRPLGPDDLVAPFEIAAALGWPVEDVLSLATGPFALGERGLLSLRVALGLLTFAALGQREVLNPALALTIAMDAAAGARLDADRSLLVAWDKAKPRIGWVESEPTAPSMDVSDILDNPLRMPLVVIPADRMFFSLALGIGLVRERSRASAH